MTSSNHKEAFVWIWLPHQTEPVVAGRLEADNGNVLFNYGKSYLERIGDQPPAIPIYEPELPLRSGALPLPDGLNMPGSIRDAAPDAWGRRVIINKKLGRKGADADTAELDELTYLLESGSDRIGALDFQHSPTEYVPRSANNVTMEELLESAERVEKGVPLTPDLDQALFHGSSIGGARPKALIQDQGKKYVAKFSSSTDLYSVVKAEFIAMRLAELAGLNVAQVKLIQAANKEILLIERFDRQPQDGSWSRKSMVSALTYDICPQGRAGNEASQAMLISGNNNLSQLKTCLEAARHFLLSGDVAHTIFAHLTETIEQNWEIVCKEAALNEVDMKLLWKRQFLNPYSLLL